MTENKFESSRVSEGTLQRGAHKIEDDRRAPPEEPKSISRDAENEVAEDGKDDEKE